MHLRFLLACLVLAVVASSSTFTTTLQGQVSTTGEPPTLQQTFDKLSQEKNLGTAARYLLLTVGTEALISDTIPLLSGKPGDRSRETTLSFFSGLKDFARSATKSAFEAFFVEGGTAKSEEISLSEGKKRLADSVGTIEVEKSAVQIFLDGLSGKDLQILQFTLPTAPGGPKDCTIALTLLFTQEELSGVTLWRLHYAYGMVVNP
jgi:hypothetical protein